MPLLPEMEFIYSPTWPTPPPVSGGKRPWIGPKLAASLRGVRGLLLLIIIYGAPIWSRLCF